MDTREPVVFQSNARQDTRGAAVDMLLLGMCNDTGASRKCRSCNLNISGDALWQLVVPSPRANTLCACSLCLSARKAVRGSCLCGRLGRVSERR